MSVRSLRLGGLAGLIVLLSACSVVVPLGDEYTFGDAGPTCTVPTQEEACAGRCGSMVVCETQFACGGCTGELSCGAQTNVCACASSPCAVASSIAGDSSKQTIVGLAVDGQGNVFVTGLFRGTVTFGEDTYTNPGASTDDIFLVKMSPTGSVLWSRAYGDVASGAGNTEQSVVAIDVDAAGNVVLVGHSYTTIDLGGDDLPAADDIILLKLDGSGNHVWSASYGSQYETYARALSVDKATGDILVTGTFWGTLKFGDLASMTAAGVSSYRDIFVVRFQPNGTPAVSKRFGDGDEQVSEAIASSGNFLYLTAYFRGTFDFGSINMTSLSTTSSYSLALTKLGTTGLVHSWSRQYGTSVGYTRLAADTAGNVFVSGGFGDTLDIVDPPLDSTEGDRFLARIDASGNTVWAKQFANVSIHDLAVGADGSLYLAGDVYGATDLGGGPIAGSSTLDPFIAHYAADGTHLWSRVFQSAVGHQYASGVGAAPDGSVWMGASFEGQIDFGLGAVNTQGGYDVAVTRYVP